MSGPQSRLTRIFGKDFMSFVHLCSLTVVGKLEMAAMLAFRMTIGWLIIALLSLYAHLRFHTHKKNAKVGDIIDENGNWN